MALPSSGQISIGDIITEGGVTPTAGGNYSMGDMQDDVYYWGFDPEDDGDNGNVVLADPVYLTEFYNATYGGFHY